MTHTFREFVDGLRHTGQLIDVKKPVDIRHIAALVDKSDKALVFHNVNGYAMPVVSGVANSRERIGFGLGCDYAEIYKRSQHGLENPIEPVEVHSGPVREVLQTGDEVDLFELPIPMFSVHDGGPMITAGVTVARDDFGTFNAGMYRFLVKERNLTCIDIVTSNDLQRIARKALAENKPVPISISIGTSLAVNMGAAYRAPIGTNELTLAGGIAGEAVRLTPCETVDVPCIADAEIVLEAEILPTGWTKPEGRFGEFTRLMGGLHWNPHVRINAVSMRQDAMYYALHMPWEVILTGAPNREAALRNAFKLGNLELTAVNVTPGASCYFHAIVAIRKRPGDAKHAIMAALMASDLKRVVVVDDDIDVFDPLDVEWAMATRVQADRDIVIVPDCRSKPLDPSLRITPGITPVTAKYGVDATIPDDLPRERFERIAYAFADSVSLERCLGEADGPFDTTGPEVDIADLAGRICKLIAARPLYFADLTDRFEQEGFKAVSRAIGKLHHDGDLWQDPEGRLCLAGSEFAATPPS
jgi:2,5-furandicarboxylate decarboxylase 1